jgi:prolyl oligopeptidase
MIYPEAERVDVVDVLHGHRVPDPYRWLEDLEDPRTVAWSEAQDVLVRAHLDGLPGRDRLRQRLRELMPGAVSAPAWRGDRCFFSRRLPDQELATFLVREADGTERVLLDPHTWSDDFTVTLDGVAISLEGDRVAYLRSDAGTEDQSLWVADVATGAVLEGPVDVGRAGSLAWLAGGEELIVVRRLPDLPEEERQFHRRVYRHRVGAPPADDAVLFGEGRDKTTYYDVSSSPDGRWLVISCSLGTAPRNDVYLLDLHAADTQPVVVQEGVDAETWATVHADGRLYLHTNLSAPRRRVAVTDPRTPSAAHWVDLLPESDAVLDDYDLTDDALIACRSRHAATEVAVHDLASGSLRHKVELPGMGMASVVTRLHGGDDAWLTYTDHVTPVMVLEHRVPEAATSTWATAPGAVEIDGVLREQVFVTSPDGTQVPMFVVRRADVSLPAPTTLYGYGGFTVSMTPAYSAAIVAWVEAGGVWAEACLRGGSEEGEEWHRAGMRENKQNVFDDFHACAEWLIERRLTTPEQLVGYGGSNGGLLVGAALTQRPDLFAAILCSAPLLDMVRYEQFGLGVTWNDEYGTVEDATELGWLLSYSPYHHVREATAYPAVLFTVFESDTRVDPLHARKMCAAVQSATTSDPDAKPVLIRREVNVGHGARSVSRTIELSVDTLVFRAAHAGLSLG